MQVGDFVDVFYLEGMELCCIPKHRVFEAIRINPHRITEVRRERNGDVRSVVLSGGRGFVWPLHMIKQPYSEEIEWEI